MPERKKRMIGGPPIPAEPVRRPLALPTMEERTREGLLLYRHPVARRPTKTSTTALIPFWIQAGSAKARAMLPSGMARPAGIATGRIVLH